MTGFFSGIASVAATELNLFKRFPKTVISALGISLVPALYLLIYISSVWDPSAHTNELKVAIVNHDRGYTFNGKTVNAGEDVVITLKNEMTFGFYDEEDDAAVRHKVERGEIAFAIIIPADFSQKAVPGIGAGAARVHTIISEGNNYTAAGFGRRFSVELSHKINETLSRNRWELVLATVEKAGGLLDKLNSGVAELRNGAAKLNEGAGVYASAAGKIAEGFSRVGDAVREMNEKFPQQQDLQALANGTGALVKGQESLEVGLKKLRAGANKITEGADLLGEKSKSIPFVGGKVATGAEQIAGGGKQLSGGIGKAISGNRQLADGARKLEEGTGKLVTGLNKLGEGIGTLAEKIPEDNQLNEFAEGGKSLADGANQLLAGIDRMVAELPKELPKIEGNAAGLADPVHTELDVLNPVANNGTALVPNMASVALWVGAVMIGYLFQMRLQLSDNRKVNFIAKGLGKYIVPGAIAALQATIAYFVLVEWLGVAAPDKLLFWLSLVIASLTFFSVIFAMLRVFGEAGKLLAVLFLTLQLSAGGGIAPIELAGGFYQAVNPWLPFTWVVKALRAALFGAFENNLTNDLVALFSFGAIALIVAIVIRPWKYMEKDYFRPGVEL